MNFGGVDTWAIVLAAVVGYIVGAAWYMALSKPWLAAKRLSLSLGTRNPLSFIASGLKMRSAKNTSRPCPDTTSTTPNREMNNLAPGLVQRRSTFRVPTSGWYYAGTKDNH